MQVPVPRLHVGRHVVAPATDALADLLLLSILGYAIEHS